MSFTAVIPAKYRPSAWDGCTLTTDRLCVHDSRLGKVSRTGFVPTTVRLDTVSMELEAERESLAHSKMNSIIQRWFETFFAHQHQSDLLSHTRVSNTFQHQMRLHQPILEPAERLIARDVADHERESRLMKKESSYA